MARKTIQRQAILQALTEANRPLRVAEILAMGREAAPTLDQATVYRNLNRLVEERVALRIVHPDLGTLFEIAGKGHHHHFHCRVCDRVLELPGCALEADHHAPKGFRVESHELYLSGVCAACGMDH